MELVPVHYFSTNIGHKTHPTDLELPRVKLNIHHGHTFQYFGPSSKTSTTLSINWTTFSITFIPILIPTTIIKIVKFV